jgi:carboxyl-terminal processing protease
MSQKLQYRAAIKISFCVLTTAVLVACGGGGINESRLWQPDLSDPTPSNKESTSLSSEQGTTSCAINNPFRADSGTHKVGTLSDEKAWIKNYVQSAYLWYQDIPAVNAGAPQYSDENAVYGSLDNYFQALKSPLVTASGAKKDKFSFTYPTKQWEQLFASGITFSYGIEWQYSSKTAPWQLQVLYVAPNSPADNAGIARGDQLKSIDSLAVDGSDSGVDKKVNAALYPNTTAKHSFVISRAGSSDKTIDLIPGNVTSSPVLMSKTLDHNGSKVGYMVFNEHIATAEQQLINSVSQFKADQIDSLVLDMRYNGGGYLYIASELAYMIAGAGATQGKVFEQLQYNDKRKADTADGKTIFYSESCILNIAGKCTNEKPLPSLNLKQLFVITTESTCSASEAIINGLRGVDIDVQIIGNTTCGKPYGFVGKSNCGISYFPMEFQGVNAKGSGDYADGFKATCAAKDDLSKPLGDVNEGMLSAALYRKSNPTVCKPTAGNGLNPNGQEAHMRRPVVLENKIWIPR